VDAHHRGELGDVKLLTIETGTHQDLQFFYLLAGIGVEDRYAHRSFTHPLGH
jgi:hypothetical protein